MIQEFNNLTEDEMETLLNTPVWITLLIAGADNVIDKKEIEDAIHITKHKKTRAREDLINYYTLVDKKFATNLQGLLELLPEDPKEISEIAMENIRKLNDIFPKLEKSFAIHLYESLKDFSNKIAKSTGGVLGYLSVGYEEAKLVDLKLVNDPSKS